MVFKRMFAPQRLTDRVYHSAMMTVKYKSLRKRITYDHFIKHYFTIYSYKYSLHLFKSFVGKIWLREISPNIFVNILLFPKFLMLIT